VGENVAFVLEKRFQNPVKIDNLPIIRGPPLNLYLIPREEKTWANNFSLDVAVPDRHQRLQSNCKVIVAGVVEKGIFAVSAEL
jgi:hypothetical protein